MTEKELIDLGFKKIDVEAEEGVYPFDWYHYEYSFSTDYDVLELRKQKAKYKITLVRSLRIGKKEKKPLTI